MNKNKQHWNNVGADYNSSWLGKSKKNLSLKETNFINEFLFKNEPINVLDIGIGNGRILDNFLKNTKKSKIYGVDISQSMVSVCKKRFSRDNRIQKLAVCDFSKEKIPFNVTFDFITAIRVFKYNKNWPEMIGKASRLLNYDGVFVFSMPNKYSLNIFSFNKIPMYRSSKKELENICKNYSLELLDIQSFTRIPDLFYNLFDINEYSKFIITIEFLLSRLLGKTFLGRMLFLAVRKNKFK